MKKVFFFILISLTYTSIKAQDTIPTFQRTGLYLETGLGDYAHLDLNLEHYFLNKTYWHLGVRTGYGGYGTWGGHEGKQTYLTLSGLLGKKYHFLELQAGGTLLFEKYRNVQPLQTSSKEIHTTDFRPFASLGYTLRYKHFLFKANVNTMITINGALGFVF